jgi:hypothetical protein
MPLMAGLLPSVRKAVTSRSGRLQKLLPLLGDDIEVWLSYLSQPLPWLDAERALYHQSVFAQLSQVIAREILRHQNLATAKPAPKWLPILIEKWCENNSAVMTLNYDTLLEKSFWSVGHVPFHVLYQVPILDIGVRTGESRYAGTNPDLSYRLFKLHGSVDWYYSGPTGHDETLYHAHFSVNWLPDPPSEIARRVGGLVPMLVPPVATKDSYFTNDRLREQWILASRALRDARRLFLIGYSMPPSDQMMRMFLGTADRLEVVYIVNRSSSVADRAREYFVGRRINRKYVRPSTAMRDFAIDYSNDLV